MRRQLTDLNFKWEELVKMIPSLFAVREITPFQLYDLFCIHLGIYILDLVHPRWIILREQLTSLH